MTTEKDKDQTKQQVTGQNQDPHRKVPDQTPADPPKGGEPVGTQTSMNTTST